MKDLCKDVNFDCSEKGLQVQSMDSSHVALVSLLLRESAFADFKCDRPTSLGMNVDCLAKILKMCGPTDSLKLRWQSGADTVSFQCESEGDADRERAHGDPRAALQGHCEAAVGRVPEDLPGPEGVRRDDAGEGEQGRHYFQCAG